MNSKHKIIVVDDDPEMLLRDFLTSRGYSVSTVSSAAGALETLNKGGASAPDLIISDIHMRPMNGLELAKQVKALREELARKCAA